MSQNRMIASLLNEYNRATLDLYEVLQGVSQEEFIEIKDASTTNIDCQSIQSLCRHMVQSGYTYANYFYSITSEEWNEYENKISNPEAGVSELKKMLEYTASSLEGLMSKSNEEIGTYSISVRWGTTFNIEQLFSHAIVHILRHRRQIENFLIV